MIHRKLLMATAIIASVVTASCSDTTASSQPASNGSSSESSGRSKPLHITKECSAYTGLAGSYCTITQANLKALPAGTKEFALRDVGPGGTSLDSDIIYYASDGNLTFGHCTLDDLVPSANLGCTFSGGIGQLRGFHASLVVTGDPTNPVLAHMDGTYYFSDRD